MSKLPVIRKAGTEALIASVESKIERAEAELLALGHNTIMPASELVAKRNALTAELAALQEELAILEKRLEVEKALEAKRTHAAKVNKVSAILKRRLGLMQELDAALAVAAEAARKIKKIDADELISEIGGLDSRYGISNADWQLLALRKLAELGLGVDNRMDKGVPTQSPSEHASTWHALILSELTERPRVMVQEAERKEREFKELRKHTAIGW